MLADFQTNARQNWLNDLFSTFAMTDEDINVAVGADLRPFWSAQFDAMRANSFSSMMFNLVFALLVALIMQGTGLDWQASVWALVLSGVSLFMLVGRRGHRRTRGGASGLLVRAVGFGILFALLWGVVSVWFSPEVSGNQRTLLFAVSMVAFSLGVFSLARVPLAAIVFAFVFTVALLIGVFRMGGGSEMLGASLILAAAISAVVLVLRFNAMSLLLARATVANRQNKQTVQLLARAVPGTSPVWICQTDMTGALTVVPEELAALTNRSAERLRGARLDQLCRRKERSDEWEKVDDAMRAGRAFSQVPVEVMIEGAERWWVLSGEPIVDQSGQMVGYRCICFDVTSEEKSKRRTAQTLADKQASREQWELFWGTLCDRMLSQLSDVANVISLSGDSEKSTLDKTTHEGLQPMVDAMQSLRLYCRLARDDVQPNNQKLDLAEMAMFGVRAARFSASIKECVGKISNPLVEENGTLYGDMELLKRMIMQSILVVCRSVKPDAIVNTRVRRSRDASVRVEVFGLGDAKALVHFAELVRQVRVGELQSFSPDDLEDIAKVNVIKVCHLHDGHVSVRRTAEGEVGLCIAFPASRVEFVP